jgi:hypothetical protein
MRLVGHVASIGGMRNLYKILLVKAEGKGQFGRVRCRWEDNIRMDLKEIFCEDKDWIHTA